MDNSIYEKDSITINKKLVYEHKEGEYYVTRIPYTHEYVKFPENITKWISEKTMKVNITDDMKIYFSQDEKMDNIKEISGKELKEHYDAVLNKQLERDSYQKSFEQKYITQPEIEHKEITLEDKNNVIRSLNNFDDFSQRVYKDDNALKYYPQFLQEDYDFNKLLSYRNQQQIFNKDYIDRQEIDKVKECRDNINVVDSMISEKTDAAANYIQTQYKAEIETVKNCSPLSLDIEQFKSFPADLQQNESFKELVIYKAQLEDWRNQCIEVLNNNTMNYQNALDKAAPDLLLQYEKSLIQNEKLQLDNIAQLTQKINNVNFAIDYQVSKMQSIKPMEIKPIGEQMNSLGLKTTGQAQRLFHSPENVMKIGKPFGNLSIYQTRDGRNFIGRMSFNGIEQIGAHNSLDKISKSYKNHIKECKKEMSLELKQNQKLNLSFERGR